MPPQFRCADCAYATDFEAGASAHSRGTGHLVVGERWRDGQARRGALSLNRPRGRSGA